MVLVKCGKIDTPCVCPEIGIYIFTTICSNVYLLQPVIFYDFLSIPLSLSLSVSHMARKDPQDIFLFHPVYPDLIIIYCDEIATISLSTTSQPFPLPPYDDDDDDD